MKQSHFFFNMSIPSSDIFNQFVGNYMYIEKCIYACIKCVCMFTSIYVDIYSYRSVQYTEVDIHTHLKV